MNIFEKVDGVILAFFTKISHKFQRLTGRTNFFLAKVSFTFMAMGLMLCIVNYWFPLLSKKGNLFSVFISLVLCFSISKDLINCDNAENNFMFSETAKPIFDLVGEVNYGFRLFWVCAFLFFDLPMIVGYVVGFFVAKTSILFEILYNDLSFSMVMCLYLIAVTPLPPGKNKIREWIENFANMFRKPVPVKTRG